MELLFISSVAMVLRIVLLGSERIFLKQLDQYNSLIITSLFSLIAAIFLIPSLFFVSETLTVLNLIESQLTLLNSMIYAIGFYMYVRAISMEDASLIAPLYNSSLLWLMLFGSLFLDENVTITRILGGILIFVGVFILYPGPFKMKVLAIKSSPGSIYMIIGSLFFAVGRSVDTYSIREIDPKLYAFLINFYVGVYLLVLSISRNKLSEINSVLNNNLRTLLFAGMTNGWAYLFLLIAIAGLEVTVAEPLSLLSLFVTAFLGKYVLGEQVKERIPGTILIVIGALFLFI